MTDRRLLLVHAHPDDETLTTGATMARYAAEGAHVALVTCTLGEEGEVIPPELAHLSGDALGEHRFGELAAACEALGVSDHRFLGGAGRWRDSGMMGTAPNDHPRAFWRADLEEATGELVAVLREVRPQVVVSYDGRGGYGHPDHIQAHRVTVAACRAAADPGFAPHLGAAHRIERRYETAVPRSALDAGLAALRAGDHPFTVPSSVDDLAFGNPDEEITTTVDGSAHLARKVAALRAHATQVVVSEPFFALSDRVGHALSGVECFTGGTRGETDLFGGAA